MGAEEESPGSPESPPGCTARGRGTRTRTSHAKTINEPIPGRRSPPRSPRRSPHCSSGAAAARKPGARAWEVQPHGHVRGWTADSGGSAGGARVPPPAGAWSCRLRRGQLSATNSHGRHPDADTSAGLTAKGSPQLASSGLGAGGTRVRIQPSKRLSWNPCSTLPRVFVGGPACHGGGDAAEEPLSRHPGRGACWLPLAPCTHPFGAGRA